MWIVIDSCIDPRSSRPASLSYFAGLGVPEDAVELVLVTHWDDDHIRGIAEVVRECRNASVACSAALNRKDVLQFVIEAEHADVGTGTGVDELRSILRLARPRGSLIYAKANLRLHPRREVEGPFVVALSPSEEAVERGIIDLIEAATGLERAVTGRFRAPEGPNGGSVACSLRSGSVQLLLGADLEVSNNPESGWEAVLKYAKPSRMASLVKVPHHGSEDAHHDGMWSEMVEPNSVAIVTPLRLGRNALPTPAGLKRIHARRAEVYITALPTLRKARLDRDVERVIKRAHRGKVRELRGWGHVRARRRRDGMAWNVELDGDARHLAPEPT